jgi:diguanylate cyclase (GGDEF)-like protein
VFNPARKSMPAIDYVSIVKSLYTDRRAMVMAAMACIVGSGLTAYAADSPVLWTVTVGFVLVTAYRYMDSIRFERDEVGATDVVKAAKWENHATYGAVMFALLCGFWCFSALVFVDDPFVELASFVLCVSSMVGTVTRNFGLERLLTIQLTVAISLMAAGLLIKGEGFYWFLAVVMVIILISYRKLAADVRAVLLNAVHSRVEANRLAMELDAALDTMQHGLCMLDGNGLIAVANDRAEAVFAGFIAGNWTGRSFSALISAAAARGSIPQRAAERLMETVRAGGGGKVVLRLPGSEYCEVTVSSRQDRTVLLFEDITERVKAEERINFMAHYDVLTGLPNRAYFTEQVESDIERRQLGANADGAMLMIIDIDDFKHVNDSMGHLVGDRVLIETSERLSKALGRDSLMARLGGDEFIVYRGSGVDERDVRRDADAILAAFKEPFQIMGEALPTNVSIGIVISTDPADDLDALMTKADLALYRAKGNGKSQARVFHDEMDTNYRYRQRLKAELKQCLANGGLTLVYQPIVDLNSRKVVSCEALARWHHPELGSIPPSLFIPIAEETGMISDITRWVLATAAAECCTWPEDVSVSINISARDFRNASVTEMVEEALNGSGLAPHRLELEVTETALIEERDAATTILSELAKRGIGIALDDFGTGYSSLSYLQALPFTKLKIDRSFVMDITSNPRSLKLLQNVAQLGKDINLTVTAEGVETEEQLSVIAENTKVDQIQGYLFGVPLPKRNVYELITRMAGGAPAEVPTARVVNGR